MMIWAVVVRQTGHQLQRRALHVGSVRIAARYLVDTTRLAEKCGFQDSLYSFAQKMNISTSRAVLDEEPVRSPLTQLPVAGDDNVGTSRKSDSTIDTGKKKKKDRARPKENTVNCIMKRIRQSPSKLNRVARVVRGMRVNDALIQMTVFVKRSAGIVFKALQSARANAVHNNGLDPEKLLVAEAYVGKGIYLRRIRYHGKGRSGVMHRKFSRLTVKLREMTERELNELALLKEKRRKGIRIKSQLLPHKLVPTIWSVPRRPKASRSHQHQGHGDVSNTKDPRS